MSENSGFVPTDLESRIRRAREHAIHAGFTPTEVWIGPVEQKFMDAIFQRSGQIAVEDQVDVLMNGLSDGTKQWESLTIRFMAAPGVRVGVSVEELHPVRDPLYEGLG